MDESAVLRCLKYGKSSKSYSPKVRAFAITLHFYSPRAYSYVRSVFCQNLHSTSTIRNWYCSINGAPGFSEEALGILKAKANTANANGNEMYACLIFDEMHIHTNLEYDHAKRENVGYISYGTGKADQSQNESPLAKEALVFLVSGVNEKFKIPIGYFFINGLSSSEKAALIQEALLLLSRSGVKIIGLTFDGLPANSTACKEIDPSYDDTNPFIVNPHSSDETFVLLDACHMLKCVRNTLINKQVLYDANNEQIKWSYIEELYKYQRVHNVNLGNKITKRHVECERHKMSVRIAAETLSNSVADSLELLLKSGVEEFINAKPTIKFIRIVNDVFDVMNSKYSDAKHFKRPMSEHSADSIFALFEKASDFFQSLKLKTKKRGIMKCILNSKSHTGFTGFLQNMKNFSALYTKYVETGIMDTLFTFRFSQDHLETLFGCIRQMFGCNTNPTVRQFESAFKRLVGQHQITANQLSNCQDDEVKILTVSSNKNKSKHDSTICEADSTLVSTLDDINETVSTESSIGNELDETLISSTVADDPDQIDIIRAHALAYNASLVEEKIIAKQWHKPFKCEKCIEVFSENDLIEDSYLTSIGERKQKLIPLC